MKPARSPGSMILCRCCWAHGVDLADASGHDRRIALTVRQLSKAFARLGAEIVAMGEVDEDAQDMLTGRHEHPRAMIMGDTARLEYMNIPWSRHSFRVAGARS